MRYVRWWVIEVLLAGMLLCGVAWGGAVPAGTTMRVMSYDLQGRKGPLAVGQYAQLESLLMYFTPDVVALGNVLAEAGRDESKPLVRTAQALDMYYAYQPLDDKLGSALLSKYPIRNATCLFDQKTQATIGMQLALQVGPRSYNLFIVRAPTATVARTTTAAVLQQTKALAGSDFLVLASFSPGTGAKQTVAAWTKAGMFDALARGKQGGASTFPYEKPKERLDYVLLSGKLRTDFVSSQVIPKGPRLLGLSEHLPVEVTVRK